MNTANTRQLLVAPAGFGKTYHCLNQFRTLLSDASDLTEFQSYYIVPTQEHAVRITDLILREKGLNSIPEGCVTTFEGFSRTILRQTGRAVVTDILKNLFIKEVLGQLDLDYFSKARDFPGTVDLIAAFIGEVKESGLSVDAAVNIFTNAAAKWKMYRKKYDELGHILHAYQKRLDVEGLYDSQDVNRLLCDAMESRNDLTEPLDRIFIDSFFEFSPVQLSIVRFLSNAARCVTIALTSDPDPRGARFDAVCATHKYLLKEGFQVSVVDDGGNRRARNRSLKSLEEKIFLDQARPCHVPVRAVEIMEGASMRGEMDLIARRIRALYAEGKYHFSDFCIIFRRIGSYGTLIKRVFDDFEIPVTIHERSKLKNNGFVVSLMSLLRIFGDGWQKEDIFRFLRSGLLDASAALIAQMERYVYADGDISGRVRWQGEWEGFPVEQDSDRKNVLTGIAELEHRMRSERTCSGYTNVLREFIERFSSRQVGGDVPLDGPAIRRLLKVLDELVYSFKRRGDQEVGFEEFFRVLNRTVDVTLFSEHSWGKDRVQVYDILIARPKEFEVVFMPGLIARSFPRRVIEDPILKDAERKAFTASGKMELALKCPRQSVERYLFYLGITRARERLFLTYPRFEEDGREAEPSFYIEDVRACFRSAIPTERQRTSDILPEPEAAQTPDELKRSVIWKLFRRRSAAAGNHEKDLLILHLAAWLSEDSAFRENVEHIYRSEMESAWDVRKSRRLGEKARRLLRDIKKPLSTSRLETYGACPFRYFLSYEVGVREPEEEISPRVVGSILHYALDQFFKNGGYRLPYEKSSLVMESALHAAFRELPLKGDRSYKVAVRKMEIEELADRFLRHVEIEKKEAIVFPEHFERSFGRGDQPIDLARMPDEKGYMLLRGIMDRIDLDAKGEWAVVVDYKYRKEFKPRELENGLMLQLPLYLYAVEQTLGVKPLGAYLFTLNRLKGSASPKKGIFSDEGLRALGVQKGDAGKLSALGIGSRMNNVHSGDRIRAYMEKAIDWTHTYAGGIRRAQFPVYPKLCLPYCRFQAVCRIEKWMIDQIEFETSGAEEAKAETSGAV